MKITIHHALAMTLISTFACMSIAGAATSPTKPKLEAVGRISYWQGKVNAHTDPVTSIWLGDSDCVSGAEIDPVKYCQKFYPKTTAVEEVTVTKKPPNLWNTAGCAQQYSGDGIKEYICKAPVTPRIAYWPGKVNLHRDAGGVWTKDADCSSGGQIDPLVYCKKFYPATTSVTAVPLTDKPALLWNTAGCVQQYSGNGTQEYTCNQ